MGCRCAERAQAIRTAVGALVRGDVDQAKAQASFVTRSLVEDARRGDLKRAATARLATLRNGARR